ncbi:MAG: adenylate kinase [Paludibacteraceae bacterium]
MLNIIICGAPGSGKGTQSNLLITKYNLQHISTGDLLRKEIADGTELGKYANTFILNGKLVPDETIIEIIAHKLDNLDQNTVGVALDGFPRTIAQAEALEALFKERGEETDILLDLQVEEQELIDRLLLRGKTSGRSDDNLETAQKRLEVYNNQTKPVTDFYQNIGKYVGIHGMGTIDEIFGRIVNAVDDVIA